MTKYNLRKIAQAYISGEEKAIAYQNAMRDHVSGGCCKAWTTVMLCELMNHLKIW